MAQRRHGRSLKERVASLWEDLQKVYKHNKTEYRIDTLTPEKLNKGNVPALKALAAQVKLLMPLLPILAEKHTCLPEAGQVSRPKPTPIWKAISSKCGSSKIGLAALFESFWGGKKCEKLKNRASQQRFLEQDMFTQSISLFIQQNSTWYLNPVPSRVALTTTIACG